MTGKTDIISTGNLTIAIDNGHEYLGMVTGTGCTLGTTISAAVSAWSTERDDPEGIETYNAVVAALLLFEIAAERAADSPHVQGPGSFVPAFLDSLYQFRTMAARGEDDIWLTKPRIRVVDYTEGGPISVRKL